MISLSGDSQEAAAETTDTTVLLEAELVLLESKQVLQESELVLLEAELVLIVAELVPVLQGSELVPGG